MRLKIRRLHHSTSAAPRKTLAAMMSPAPYWHRPSAVPSHSRPSVYPSQPANAFSTSKLLAGAFLLDQTYVRFIDPKLTRGQHPPEVKPSIFNSLHYSLEPGSRNVDALAPHLDGVANGCRDAPQRVRSALVAPAKSIACDPLIPSIFPSRVVHLDGRRSVRGRARESEIIQC